MTGLGNVIAVLGDRNALKKEVEALKAQVECHASAGDGLQALGCGGDCC